MEDARGIHSREFGVRSELGDEDGHSAAGGRAELINPLRRMQMAPVAQAASPQFAERSVDDRAPRPAAATSSISDKCSTAQSATPTDPSPLPPPPSEATARRMKEIRDQLVSLMIKHQAPRQALPLGDLDASTPIADKGSGHPSRSGASTPTRSSIAVGRYPSCEVFGGAAISVSTPTSRRGPSALHGAACEMCGENLRSSIRWLCLDCPGGKWNACDECFGMVVDEIHPHHTFAKVMGAKHVWRPQHYTQLGSRTECNAPSINEYTDPKTVFHLGNSCSACQGAIIGARYRCANPNKTCKGVNLCENCEASPITQHSRDHPLLKYKLPIDSCKEEDLLDRTALDEMIAALLQNEENDPGKRHNLFSSQSVDPLALLVAPSECTSAGRESAQPSLSDASAIGHEAPPSNASRCSAKQSETTRLWQAQTIEETPWGSSVPPGAIFAKSWRVRVPESSPPWTNGARIARQSLPTLSRPDSHTFRIVSETTIWPGSVMTITLCNLRAPILPGTHEESWRLVDNTFTGNNFGDILTVRIRVEPRAERAASAEALQCRDAGAASR